MRECMPNVAHMHCVQHFAANMSKPTNAEGNFEKKRLWEATWASTAAECEHIMLTDSTTLADGVCILEGHSGGGLALLQGGGSGIDDLWSGT